MARIIFQIRATRENDRLWELLEDMPTIALMRDMDYISQSIYIIQDMK